MPETERVCANCGNENPAEARFCFSCGAPLEAAAPVSESRKTVAGAEKTRNRMAELGAALA
jgi:predicted amidophosphoribosyltransferase